MRKFKFASIAVVAALSMGAISAYAAPTEAVGSVNPYVIDSSPVVSGAHQVVIPQSDVAAQWNIVRNPSTCGGIPAPRLTPADGYSAVCVNDTLRIVNDADRYVYTFTVTHLKDGKAAGKDELQVVSRLGMPVTWSAGTATRYLSGLTTDKQTGETTASYKDAFSGHTVVLDATGRSDGNLLVDLAFEDQTLLKLDALASEPGQPVVEGPQTRNVGLRETVILTPNKPLTLHSDDLEIKLDASKVAP